jgi:serine/threonine-protein kinase
MPARKPAARKAPSRAAAPSGDETVSLLPRPSQIGAPGSTPVDEPEARSPWDRYDDLGLLGRGGMGEVRRVRDRLLGRTVAMKRIAPGEPGSQGARARFLAEARLSAGLQHPGIVPIHDCGAMPDGTLWFTMDEIRGRTLGDAIAEAHREPASSWPTALRRLAAVFLRVCEAVAHAHEHGVIHRDLKPENVMLGELGEALVVDWGLARALGEGEAAPERAPMNKRRLTQSGHVLGTPAYMPPEQARGLLDRVDRRSDVYALGSILHEILTGAPPFSGSSRNVLAAVIAGAPPALVPHADRPLPPELLAAHRRATAREPDDRFPDAGALAAELRAYLDGVRQRDRAIALVREAEAIAPAVEAREARARALRSEAALILAALAPHDPVETKARGWALEDEARALTVAAAIDRAAWQTRIHAALSEAPDLAEAREALADLHAAELRRAEAARDPAAVACAEALLAQHDRGRHAALLRGIGSVSLSTDPAGAEVQLSRYVERGRRLVLEPLGLLGRTPLVEVPLARGSYLLQVRAPGHVEMRYPVQLGRGEAWSGVRPGDRRAFVVPLLCEGALRDGEIYSPAGPFAAGGDPAAGEALPAQTIWVEGFLLDRDPVTVADYLAFLNDLVAHGRHAEAEACCPCVPASVAGASRVPALPRDARGRYLAPAGDADARRRPIVSLSWSAASAHAAWRAAKTGQPWRLPSEIEREKAARGVDGRFFPWGDHPEPTWASMAGSRVGAPALAPIDEHPIDESPHGVRGLAGNVRDWCLEVWTPAGPKVEGGVLQLEAAAPDDLAQRSLRGGAYYSAPQLCRAAARFAARPGDHGAAIGLRLARSLPR